ncbi:MAG: FecR domain-containing protein [Ginsengibacter sp.]
MDQNRIRFLLKLYSDQLATPKEVEELFDLLKTAEPNDQLKKLFVESVIHTEPEIVLPEEAWDTIWNNISAGTFLQQEQKTPVMLRTRTFAAAVVAAIVGIAGFFIVHKKKQEIPVAVTRNIDKEDIRPGGNKALLTLGDGTSIVLDTAQMGYLASQSNTKIIKLNAGLLSYKNGKTPGGKILMNTITTPRGGQYELELEDGTRVWLNSASSLVFPTSFTGKERSVELKGEGYFEVARNVVKPFHVTVNNVDVRVLGTHFNIMSYGDEENINTTLLEGKVNVTANSVTKSLVPGKEAIVNRATNSIEINKANIDEVIAWKNGEFRFKNTGIRELMRQVARWYNVEVEYETTTNGQYFTASLPRMQNIAALLETLELTGTIHFKIDNRKIIVLP